MLHISLDYVLSQIGKPDVQMGLKYDMNSFD